MIRTLLVRGLVVGALAGVLAGVFAFVVGEPRVDRAIAIEKQVALHDAHAGAGDQPPLQHAERVGRDAQRAGLILATGLYGLALGALFALAYAFARGRVGPRGELSLALSVATSLFVAIALVPFLKYPASPPGVGDPTT